MSNGQRNLVMALTMILITSSLAAVYGIALRRAAHKVISPASNPVGFSTVTYDGHRWVKFRTGSIAHHPDCSCTSTNPLTRLRSTPGPEAFRNIAP